MRHWKHMIVLIVWLLLPIPLFGGTGRPEDGLLFWLILMGFLGILLGIIYLIDLIKSAIKKLFHHRMGEGDATDGI